jgi:molybdate transport system regulatory protein
MGTSNDSDECKRDAVQQIRVRGYPVRKVSRRLRQLANGGQSEDCRDMETKTYRPRLRIRIIFGDAEMIGPGKAELLERIDRCGSIAAAGREMGMSYKRAWELVGTLNAMFRDPLVESTRGGPGGGGAVLTQAGHEVLDLYRAFEVEAAEAGALRLAALQSRLKDIPKRK